MLREIHINSSEVEQEFDATSLRAHIIACWVGIILNLAWAISDYFVFPEYLTSFISWRFMVSAVTFCALLFRNTLNVSIYGVLFILVLGISVQNAYMWSVMDEAHMKQHTFAYIALFIGAGMLVLWEFRFSVWILIATLISNFLFFSINQTQLSFAQFMIDGGLLVFTVAIFSVFLIRSRRRMGLNEISSRIALQQSKEMIQKEHETVLVQKQEIESQKNLLEESNREITSSITYAKRIQSALMPGEEQFVSHFTSGFVFFQPKDIVSGDFFWIADKKGKIFFAVADCTGHGVPGGFMTMLGLSFLEEIVMVELIHDPGAILDRLREKIITTLKQTGNIGENKDGMDLVFCCLDPATKILHYAAANNSLFVVRGKELWELKADKQPCGFFHELKPFNTRSFQLIDGDSIYAFSDGYPDQFGGPKGKKFKYAQLENLLLENAQLDMKEQKTILINRMKDWMGEKQTQIDDMLVVGLKV